jgi:heterotetrameric sarcosine oxidase delta subunit
MLRINCPFCGLRDEIEFRYYGDASAERPDADAGQAAFHAFVYERKNPRDWHVEWWLHAGGCRQVLKVMRNTFSHEIDSIGLPGDILFTPSGEKKA